MSEKLFRSSSGTGLAVVGRFTRGFEIALVYLFISMCVYARTVILEISDGIRITRTVMTVSPNKDESYQRVGRESHAV